MPISRRKAGAGSIKTHSTTVTTSSTASWAGACRVPLPPTLAGPCTLPSPTLRSSKPQEPLLAAPTTNTAGNSAEAAASFRSPVCLTTTS
eukprot:CAMPEP_0202884782 /NCGR_PEP_ID=MMETSP1391-20130828/41324_1 /ASSEMBLY_ACC=CAM_ASM_000867 /TAXON_ID=1034604 /ORGANISM="Chlamydomonas leiostraca, Strain SAG 11-49" /LENGTH=89 /DNA_ID=CAMNT_0049568013 /DNA_START=1616 /DNA_END=1884 /DNA_ORIENTATION=-